MTRVPSTSSGTQPAAARERMREAILDLLDRRGDGKTICPSEAARVVAGERFGGVMPAVREVAAGLADEGLIEITQGGQPIDPHHVRGPVRLRRVR